MFNPGRKQLVKDYPLNPVKDVQNAARYLANDGIDRNIHENQDISQQISPFKNRIAVKDSYKSKLGYNTML